MSFIHSSGFAYAKNLIIGVGAAVVLIGALFKIMSWPGANEALMAGLFTEAGLFLMLGILPPHKDYYWEKLYPGLDEHGGVIESGASFDGASLNKTLDGLKNAVSTIKLDTTGLEAQQEKMVAELQVMAKSMSSLKALQEADFSEIKTLTQGAGKFAAALNQVVTSISDSLKDTEVYTEQMALMSKNLKEINGVYGGVFESVSALGSSSEDAKALAGNLSETNQNLQKLNNVYGNVLAAMGQK